MKHVTDTYRNIRTISRYLFHLVWTVQLIYRFLQLTVTSGKPGSAPLYYLCT